MPDPTLAVRPRALFRKKSRFLRRAGIIPANLYGAGIDSVALQVDAKDLIRTLATISRNTPLELLVHNESKPRTAFIWKVQRHHVTDEILHVDFYHVEATRTMHAQVPLVLTNVDPTLEQFQKRILHLLPALDIETLPADLPTEILVDASGLTEIDDDVKVLDLAVSDKVTVLVEGETVVAKVAPIVIRVLEEEEEAAPVAEAAAEEGEEAPAEGAPPESDKAASD